jgi:hypothetical protein
MSEELASSESKEAISEALSASEGSAVFPKQTMRDRSESNTSGRDLSGCDQKYGLV